MKRVVCFLLILLMVGCVSGTGNPELSCTSARRITGTVKPLQITSWQYGSHLLSTSSLGARYALTSDAVDLSQFEGKSVTLCGSPVEGYPVDGGPPYLRVEKIEVSP